MYLVEGEDLIEVHEHLEGPRKGQKDDRFIFRFEHGILIGVTMILTNLHLLVKLQRK